MLKIARVTEKSSGLVFDCYAVPSSTDPTKTHYVGVRGFYACRCSCPWKKHHPSKSCKHMKLVQTEIDSKTAPLYRKPFGMLK